MNERYQVYLAWVDGSYTRRTFTDLFAALEFLQRRRFDAGCCIAAIYFSSREETIIADPDTGS